MFAVFFQRLIEKAEKFVLQHPVPVAAALVASLVLNLIQAVL